MAERPAPGTKIEFRFQEDPGFRVIHANGAWGGPLPTGELRIDFVHDSFAPPISITNEIGEDGRLSREVSRSQSDAANVVNRRLMCGIVMSPEVAQSVINLLTEKLEMMKLRVAQEKS